MSDFAHAASFTAGGEVFLGGTNDQKERPFSTSTTYLCACAAALPSRGSGAPIFTHVSKSAITLSGRRPFGGIARLGSFDFSARTSGLRSGLPATTLGPARPPLRTPSRVSRRSSPLSFSASSEWHL